MSTYAWSIAYADLCKEIEILEIRRDELMSELNFIERKMTAGPRTKLVASYSGMPNGSGADTPLPQMWQMVNDIRSVIDDVNDILGLKREAKRRMEKRMSELNTLEYKVAYMRDVERKPLALIASELNYTHSWIMKVSAKVKRLRETS